MKAVFHKPFAEPDAGGLRDVPGDILRDPGRTVKARAEAAEAARRLCLAARDSGVPILVLSSFRSVAAQSALYIDAERRHGRGRGALWVAPPGWSEHHTGLAFDLADASRPETDDEPSFEETAAFRWLKDRAGEFGFEMSFPKGNWQGVGYEPWHWRFAGTEDAGKIFHPPFWRKAGVLLKSICYGIGLAARNLS